MENKKENISELSPEEAIPIIEESFDYRDIDYDTSGSEESKRNFENYLASVCAEQSAAESTSSDGETNAANEAFSSQKTGKSFFSFLKDNILSGFFSGYREHDNKAQESRLVQILEKSDQKLSDNPISRTVNKIYNGKIYKFFDFIKLKISKIPSVPVGVAFFIYAFISVAVSFVTIINNREEISNEFIRLVLAIISCALGVIFTQSYGSIGKTFSENKLFRLIFLHFLGYRLIEHTDNESVKPTPVHFMICSLAGILLSLVSVFISPTLVWIVGISIFFFVFSLSSPEFCFNLTVLLLPLTTFMGNKTLPVSVLVIFCVFCYFVKFAIRKRSIRIEALDIYVLAFAVFYMLSGIVSVTGSYVFSDTLTGILLIPSYFLASNLLKSKRAVTCIERVIVFSAFTVSIIGIIEFITGKAEVKWLDTSIFGEETGRIVSLFQNSNVLAVFLLASIPFAMVRIKLSSGFSKLVPATALAAICGALIMTQSRGAYFAAAIIILVMLAYFFKSNIRYWARFLIFLPYLLIIIPDFAINRISNTVTGGFDSSITYRFQTWRGIISMIKENFFFGIGASNRAFSEIYPSYAVSGAEGSVHAHNIFLQMFVEGGLFGIIFFVIMIFVFIQMNSEKMPQEQGNGLYSEFKASQFAAFTSFLGMLIFGAADCIWYDRRMFLVFFTVMGISVACKRLAAENMNTSVSKPEKRDERFFIEENLQ